MDEILFEEIYKIYNLKENEKLEQTEEELSDDELDSDTLAESFKSFEDIYKLNEDFRIFDKEEKSEPKEESKESDKKENLSESKLFEEIYRESNSKKYKVSFTEGDDTDKVIEEIIKGKTTIITSDFRSYPDIIVIKKTSPGQYKWFNKNKYKTFKSAHAAWDQDNYGYISADLKSRTSTDMSIPITDDDYDLDDEDRVVSNFLVDLLETIGKNEWINVEIK